MINHTKPEGIYGWKSYFCISNNFKVIIYVRNAFRGWFQG